MNLRRYHLDANVLLRFFTGEPPEMFAAASRLIGEAERGEVILDLSPMVLAETAFTLESFYQRPRKEVAKTLLEFVKRSGVRLAERDRMLEALERVQSARVHLVDAYLAALASETGFAVASFDRDLDKFKDLTRFEPMA
jgi:predicted nucleic acid-binding protein